MLLKRLSEAIGVSGKENVVRNIIIDEIKDYVQEYKIDKLGNIIAFKKGNKEDKKIMISSHMDEMGLVVSEIGSTGLIKFIPVGQIDTKFLPSKRVRVGEKEILGVIGAKPIHLQEASERKKPIGRKSLYIDLGVNSKEEAEKLVSIGDYIGLDSEYVEFGEDLVKAKFLDSRVGCSMLIDLLKQDSEVSFYAVFSVMKNIGLRGIGPAAFEINPNISIVLQAVSTTDYPDTNNQQSSVKLGKGPGLSLYDRRNIYDKRLNKSINEISNENNIEIQYIIESNNDSDSDKIHMSREGIPTASLNIPCRYMYSPVSVINKKDYENSMKLLNEVIKYIKK